MTNRIGRRTLVLGACSLAGGSAALAAERTAVMVIATIHGAHARTPSYSYELLYARIRAFAPTAIGVELRAEDIKEPRAYLERYYPKEMIDLAQAYAPIVKGLDWLGPAIEGRPIPEGYFDRLDVKVLERELGDDAAMHDPGLEANERQRAALIPKATASSLNDGRYDVLNRRYYRRLAEHLKGTRYQPLSDFYRARDAHIEADAISLVRANPNGRVAIVIGADHRSGMVDALTARFGRAIRLVAV